MKLKSNSGIVMIEARNRINDENSGAIIANANIGQVIVGNRWCRNCAKMNEKGNTNWSHDEPTQRPHSPTSTQRWLFFALMMTFFRFFCCAVAIKLQSFFFLLLPPKFNSRFHPLFLCPLFTFRLRCRCRRLSFHWIRIDQLGTL